MFKQQRIQIVDNTLESQPPSNDGEELGHLKTGRHRSLAKKITGTSVREGLARRKYAKWQPERYSGMTPESTVSRPNSLSRPQSSLGQQTTTVSTSQPVSWDQFGGSDGPLGTGQAEGRGGQDDADRHVWDPTQPQSEIDILYENERGWFFFGLPMFSEKSLLNLDPPAWMTPNNEESPVNITNAQLPDPSWEWAWKTWYIDMSYDVDEEGWQYSFSFASNFSWHGTHPWFHSFVRRRRWLRKRVKKSTVAQDHTMAASAGGEYLLSRTVSAQSLASTSVGPSGGRSAYGTGAGMPHGEYEASMPSEQITSVPALCKAIKAASLDREKVDAVGEFVRRGGEELAHLEEKIPDILSMLLFQTSRRQLLERLGGWIDEIPEDAQDETERKKRAYLVKALSAARRHIICRGLTWNSRDLVGDGGWMQMVPEGESESTSSGKSNRTN
ncbi:hypothetical protein VTO42DRAFT_3203 [Malbranchea cinnamomea]